MQFDPLTDLTLTRTVAAPRHTLWACWTTPRHLMQFFMPAPYRLSACEIDLRPGGRFNTTMIVDGQLIENRGVFLEVADENRLVFTDGYSEGWVPAADPFMTAIISFEDAAGGGTCYTATARHRTPDARQAHEDMGFDSGWNTVATQLETYARSLP